ncbi:hypothetical protein FRK02_22485 [Salmonella enterica]|nr:hypothetical protein [Salmonella enterica]
MNAYTKNIILNAALLTSVLLVPKEGIGADAYYVTSIDASATISGQQPVSSSAQSFEVTLSATNIKGHVRCVGQPVPDEPYFDTANHRFSMMYPPMDGEKYRINDNVSVSVKYGSGSWTPDNWISYYAAACSTPGGGNPPDAQAPAASLAVAQPFKFTFYVNKFPADGILRLPDGLMGYYTRYFGENPASSRPPVTIPFYINGFALTFDSICQWDVNDIILDYGILSPGDTRKISAPAGFTCNRDSRVKVRLDTTWGTGDETGVSVDLRDAEGTKTVGQSRVQITGNSVGGNGREVIVTAPTGVKQNFMVSSELDTRGMPAGVFQGSAVLIATLE